MASKILRVAIAALLSVSALSSAASCSSPSPQATTDADAGAETSVCTAFTAGPAPSPSTTITKAQVDAIVNISCSFTSCHGAKNTISKLYLPKPPSAWAANMIDQPSLENPAMKIVVAGDPNNSWMIQKITGGKCAFLASCVASTCGDQMPQGVGAALGQADQTTLIEWVRQGAVQN
ncbi:MAG: hypothetical protein ACHREM_23325 [Polyangiales bacterium]